MSESLNSKVHRYDRRAMWINALIVLIIFLGACLALRAEPYHTVPVSCQDQLRVSNLKYKAVAAEVLSLENTIKEFRAERGIINGG